MFIPLWLVVVIVLLIVMAVPGVRDAVTGMAILAFVLALLVSIPAAIYFYVNDEFGLAFVVGTPIWLVLAWQFWTDGRKEIRSWLWLHQLRVRTARLEDVQGLRQGYADALELGAKAWQFFDRVKYFPRWYSTKDSDGEPWKSNAIPRNDIIEFSDPRAAADLGIDPTVIDEGAGPCIARQFGAPDKEFGPPDKDFVFLSRETDRPISNLDGFQHARVVWIIEKPSRVVAKELRLKSRGTPRLFPLPGLCRTRGMTKLAAS